MENTGSTGIAETLLAVTGAAGASVLDGDWEMAGRLLRRREQLLTQLEGAGGAPEQYTSLIQDATRELEQTLDIATREGRTGIIERAG